MNQAELDERFASLLEQWSQAEESIKKAELLESNVVIPAINELRYAGRSIVRALGKKDSFDQYNCEKELNIAEQYLHNAEHDVVDSLVAYIGQKVSELNFRFGRSSIETRFPRYGELNKVLEECRRLIEISRKALIMERLEIYKTLKSKMPSLIAGFDDYVTSNIAMTAQIEKFSAEIKSVRSIANFLIAAFLVAVSLDLVFVYFYIFR